ncbi:hypothetical protein MMC19_001953 [Ptychographa xylographoides]|nr:hypothetical protein [Ptychographa xylographoides]
MDLLLDHGATSFLPTLSPSPKVASLSQVTHIMEDLVSSTKGQSSTGLPPEPPSSASSAATLVSKAKDFVEEYMSNPHYDASHDYKHIRRVLALAEHILSVEQRANPSVLYDPTIVTLAALMHDVGDHKYTPTITVSGADSEDPTTLVKTTLIKLGASLAQARYVQTIVKSVSYSHEVRNPTHVRGVLLQHPELAIVQDADRLDALGAVGIGRTFTYGGAQRRKEGGMEETIRHFEEKLERLEGMMKTREGKRLARERTERLKMFRGWWEDENSAVSDWER